MKSWINIAQLHISNMFKSVVVPTFESEHEMTSVTIQMKAIMQYFHVVLLIMLYEVVLT